MKGKKFIIIGTDTDIGKTYVTVKLLERYNKSSLKTLGLKPISTGGKYVNNMICNEDAILLQSHSSVKLNLDEINIFRFFAPTSPNIAANIEQVELNSENILNKLEKILSIKTDLTLIETIGGLLVALNDNETMIEIVKKLDIPVILVVAIRLGCINHAILTYQILLANNIKIAGWIANDLGKMTDFFSENIETIKKFLKCKFLGIINHNGDANQIADLLEL